jgi:hypothetical protein
MTPERGSAPVVQTEAQEKQRHLKRSQDSTLRAEAAQCGKRAAIQAYCLGWLSLESCADLFRRNPDWRSA